MYVYTYKFIRRLSYSPSNPAPHRPSFSPFSLLVTVSIFLAHLSLFSDDIPPEPVIAHLILSLSLILSRANEFY